MKISEMIEQLQEFLIDHDDTELLVCDDLGVEFKIEEFTWETGDPWLCLESP